MEPEKKRASARQILSGPVLNAVLVILLAFLFAQCAVYMARYADMRRTSSDVPFDMRMLSASSAESDRTLEPTLLAPDSMTVSDGQSCRTVFHSTAVVEEMYAAMSECIAPALCGEPVLSDADEWLRAADGAYICAQYSSELPWQVICAFAAAYGGETELPRRADPYIGVRELLIAADESSALTDVYVRGTGGVFRFPLETERTAAEFLAFPAAYPDAFCSVSAVDRGDCFLWQTEDALTTRTIYTSRGVSTLLTANQDFLRLLNFNPDKLNYHTEADGTYVYVESHGILRAGADEMIYQASESGGIDIAGLGGGTDDIYAYLRAASYLIRQMESMNIQYTGGDAVLRLDSVTAAGASVTLRFVLRCDNIPLVNKGEDHGLTLTFTGEKLTVIRYRMRIVSRSLTESRVLLQSWYRRMLGGDENAVMRLVYAGDTEADIVNAQWARIVPESAAEGGDSSWDGQD